VVFVGHGFPGEVARRIDYGHALIGPGFVDRDALADLDTTILAYDNQPAWTKGRVWLQPGESQLLADTVEKVGLKSDARAFRIWPIDPRPLMQA